MPRAVIYARYSSSGQREESIEDQVRVCTEEAARNGDDVLRVYADRAATGTEAAHRAQFQRMIADSAKGAFDLVYVYKTDRFARNRYDSATYKAKLKKNGVRVVSATERIADGADGILMEAVLEGFAEYYSAQLGENVRRGLHGNALRCFHNGVRVFGYDNGADGLFHVNGAEAEAVRRMFDLYDDGAGMPEICAELRDVRTKRGRALTTNMVGKMLRDPRYTGLYRFDGVEVEGGMPQLVGREQFDRVQERLARRIKPRRLDVDYILSGYLFDAEGNRYQGSSGWGKGGTKYTYYRCPKTGHSVPQAEVEGEVAALVRAALSGGAAERIADLVLEAQDEAMCDDLAAMDALRASLESNAREQGRLVDLAAKTGATDAIAAKLDALAAEAADAKRELAELERGTPVIDRDLVRYWVVRMSECDDPMQLVGPFVRRVVIDRVSGEIRVEFTFRDGPGDGGGGGGGGLPLDGDPPEVIECSRLDASGPPFAPLGGPFEGLFWYMHVLRYHINMAQRDGQKQRVAVFDFDGTCIDGQSGALFTLYLFRRRIMRFARAARLGWWGARYKLHLPYRQSEARELVFGALAGMAPEDVDAVMRAFYHEVLEPRYRSRALEAVRAREDEGCVTLLVSATFDVMARTAAEAMGMTAAIATRMERGADGRYTGRVDGPVIAGDQKYPAVVQWCDEHLGPGNWELAYAYADHYSDKDLLARADHAYAVCPGNTLKPAAKREGWTVCDWDD